MNKPTHRRKRTFIKQFKLCSLKRSKYFWGFEGWYAGTFIDEGEVVLIAPTLAALAKTYATLTGGELHKPFAEHVLIIRFKPGDKPYKGKT